MRTIKLVNSNCAALVDDDLFDYLSGFTWWEHTTRGCNLHAQTKINGVNISMHQLILPVPNSKLEVDHKNGNGLDNQRINLRIVTRSQNNMNRFKQFSATTSKYKGVSWFKRDKCWRAYIVCKNVQMHLGYFKIEEEAARAYNEAAMKHFGEFARLNEFESK